MLSHEYNFVIDRGVGAPVHGKDIEDVWNATSKRFISMEMKDVQLPGEFTNNSQMVMHTSLSNTYTSLAREFQKIFQTQHVHMDWFITERQETR